MTVDFGTNASAASDPTLVAVGTGGASGLPLDAGTVGITTPGGSIVPRTAPTPFNFFTGSLSGDATDIGQDFLFSNGGGNVTITLSGLPAGSGNFELYLVDTRLSSSGAGFVGAGEFGQEQYVTLDGVGQGNFNASGVWNVTEDVFQPGNPGGGVPFGSGPPGADELGLRPDTIPYISDGINDVVLTINGASGAGSGTLGNQTRVAGFTVTFQAIPEPTGLALALVGLVGAAVSRRRS